MARPVDGRGRRRIRWGVRVGVWVVRLLGITWRTRRIRGDLYDRLRDGHIPAVFVHWHGHILPLLYQHRHDDIIVLISEHADGEVIARIAERLGYRTVRGSTSNGASRALIAITRELKGARQVAVTPDGPRGPARTFAPGALVAARRAGVPVVAVAATAAHAWHLRSWDRFLIPKPFTRVTIAYAAPTFVNGDSSRAAADDAERFRSILESLEREAAVG